MRLAGTLPAWHSAAPFGRVLLILAMTASALCAAPPPKTPLDAMKRPSPEQEAFFETKVRPLLVTRCIGCHGEKQQKGGIRLDSAEALLGKNPEDALVDHGKPEESRLLEVISYKEDPKMPPEGKLPDAEIQILHDWVKRGAHFPAKGSGPVIVDHTSTEGIALAKKTHWSLKPVKSYTPPKVNSQSWVKTPIDQFILAKLEESKLTPSPAVDRRTLLRRLSFDLTGLPPTYAEVQAFEDRRRAEHVAERGGLDDQEVVHGERAFARVPSIDRGARRA